MTGNEEINGLPRLLRDYQDVEYGSVACAQGIRLANEFKDWREDCIQECFIALYKAKPQDQSLANTIAHRRRIDFSRWLRHWRPYDRPTWESLDREIAGGDGDGESLTLGDMIADPDDAIENIIRKLDARSIIKQIPRDILKIAAKRVRGKPLTTEERVKLHRFRQKNGRLAELVKQL